MCMIDNCESWDWFNREERRARKEHRCIECWRAILPGERYEFAKGQIEGSILEMKVCAHCIAVREWLVKVCSGFVYEMVKEEMVEHWREGYGIWLGRAVVGMERKWQRFDGGGLMAPMTLPAVLPAA